MFVNWDLHPSIALILEKLYQTKDLARINFAKYIATLVTHLIHSYKIDPEKINLVESNL